MLARMIDVVLGTAKLKSIIRGKKNQVIIISSVEVLIYTLAASQAFKYVSNPIILAFYILGYALGYYIGMTIDERLYKPIVQATVITKLNSWDIADCLRLKGFGVTTNVSYGMGGAKKKQMIVLLEKNRLDELIGIVKEFDEDAYVFVVDVKSVGINNISK